MRRPLRASALLSDFLHLISGEGEQGDYDETYPPDANSSQIKHQTFRPTGALYDDELATGRWIEDDSMDGLPLLGTNGVGVEDTPRSTTEMLGKRVGRIDAAIVR